MSNDAPLTDSGGLPELLVYGAQPQPTGTGPLVTLTASSVGSDGSSSTYQFPTSNPGVYGYTVADHLSSGTFQTAGTGMFSVGSRSRSYPQAFGVAAFSTSSTTTLCQTSDPYGDGTCAGQTICSTTTSEDHYPLVTSYSEGSVYVNGGSAFTVGSHPTVIRTYNIVDNNVYTPLGMCQNYSNIETTQYGNAIVVNTGTRAC